MQLGPSSRKLHASRRFWIGLFACWIAGVSVISAGAYLGRLPTSILALPHLDTVMHFLLLGGCSYLSHRALGGRRVSIGAVSIPIGPLCFAIVSIGDEFTQALVPRRTFSLLDLAANLAGVLAFGWLAVRAEAQSTSKAS